VLLKLGDVDNALADARESADLAARTDEGLISAWAGMRLGTALLATGDAAGAVDVMVNAAGGELLERIPGGWRVSCLAVLLEAQLELGHVEDAGRSAEAAKAAADGLGLPYAAAMAHVAQARLELATGDPARAVESALASVQSAERAGAFYEAAVSRVVAGRALGEAGDREAAITHLAGAAEDLERFGAVRQRNASERELRRLGERIHRRTRGGKPDATGVDSLTEREVEIGHLIADRMTNREIAERLFLSPKTIETHLRNLFTKLGVSSRVQVARAIEEADRRQVIR
jgi:ATP/maltotriose-dependent transcriptional regulator MalT